MNTIVLLFLFVLNQKPEPVHQKISHEWVSFEITNHDLNKKTHLTHKINPEDCDSLRIFSNFTFERINNEIEYTGQWKLKNYSTKISINPIRSFVSNSEPSLNDVTIFELSDSLMILKYDNDKEGKSTVIKYRRIHRAIICY